MNINSVRNVLIGLLFAGHSCYSEVIIFTAENKNAIDLAGKIQNELQLSSAIKHSLNNVKPEDFVIALGNQALNHAAENSSAPVVGSFINFAERPTTNLTKVKSIIYSDPSPENISRFIDSNFMHAKIGYIYSDNDVSYLERIRSSLKPKNNTVIAIEHRVDIFVELNNLTRSGVDAILIGNNNEIYKSDNIRLILESLFRKRIPVLSTSKLLVKAGAAVAISPNEGELIKLTVAAISKLSNEHQHLKAEVFASNSEIEKNKSLLEILNLRILEVAQ